MGMVRRAWAKFNRRRHQRAIKKSVKRLQRHLAALAGGTGCPIHSFLIEMDKDISQIKPRCPQGIHIPGNALWV